MLIFNDPVSNGRSVVELVPIVTDRFENPIDDAPLVFGSEPELQTFGQGRYVCAPEGRYDLFVRVDGPT